MTRLQYIAQIRRLIYGGQPSDDADITINLVNQWLDQAIGVAAKKNYTDSIALEGIAYVNNSFYSTFKGLTISEDENLLWKITLPQIPFGIGQNEGVSTLVFKDTTSKEISYPVVWLTENQRSFQRGMRVIPNRLLAYQQSQYVYVMTDILLYGMTATATIISGGNSSDLNSTLNVPADYIPIISEYLKQQLMFERSVPKDVVNDGEDFIKTT